MTSLTRDWALDVAAAVGEASPCRRRRIGAVVTNQDYSKIWAAAPIRMRNPYEPSCLDGGCPRGMQSLLAVPAYSPYHNCISEHAEMAALDDFAHAMAWWVNDANKMPYGEDGWCLKAPFRPVMTVSAIPCWDCERQLSAVGMIVQWKDDGLWHERGRTDASPTP